MAESIQEVIIEKNVSIEEAKQRGYTNWSIWEKEVSEFDWFYDDREQCYFLEGEVTVTFENGEISFGKGDFVTFAKGLSCRWIVRKPVKKHYFFG